MYWLIFEPVFDSPCPVTATGKSSVLIIDDSPVDLEILSIVCGSLDCEVDLAKNGELALQLYEQKRHSLVVTDYRMEPMNGIHVVSRIREVDPDVQFLMITGFPDNAVRSYVREHDMPDVVTKPFQVNSLLNSLKEALTKGMCAADRVHEAAFQCRLEECPILLGESGAIQRVREQLAAAVSQGTPILLEGADGVGKLEIAKLLHRYGSYRKGDCVTIPLGRGMAGAERLFHPDGRWGPGLEQARSGSLILQSLERLGEPHKSMLREEFESIASEMRIIALEGCSLGEDYEPIHMDAALLACFGANTIRLPELSERVEDILSIVRAVAASPIQYGLARVLEDAEVEKLAEEIALYDFNSNFSGLFRHIRRLADRPCIV